MNVIDRLFEILETRGAARYGMERINQLEHALQCAHLAESDGADPALVAAALFHDLGHMLHKLGDDAAARGVDDRHEIIGARYLARWFGEATTRPIALHVDAKRYLCSAEPDYHAGLSPGSVRSLELQGGKFSDAEADRFRDQPFADDAVRLRRWDESAKVIGADMPDLGHFRPVVAASLVMQGQEN